jgi:hypothetical protein
MVINSIYQINDLVFSHRHHQGKTAYHDVIFDHKIQALGMLCTIVGRELMSHRRMLVEPLSTSSDNQPM